MDNTNVLRIGHFVVEARLSYDNPPKRYYKIKMFVSPTGLYIYLEGIYGTVDDAIREIERIEGKTTIPTENVEIIRHERRWQI